MVKAIFDPDAPQNGASLRPIDIELPEGRLANPRFPAAVSLRHLAVQRLTDILFRAFGELYPDLDGGGSFVGFSSLAAACRHPRLGNQVVIQDDLGGGMGAHAGGDGLDAVDVYLGNVQILPAEMCELQYPVRIVATELVPDSGGAGGFRGGLGIRRVYEFLDDADGVFYTEQTRTVRAARRHGGPPGTAARLAVERADGEVEISKQRLTVRPGDRLVVVTGGGGGFGDPRERDQAACAGGSPGGADRRRGGGSRLRAAARGASSRGNRGRAMSTETIGHGGTPVADPAAASGATAHLARNELGPVSIALFVVAAAARAQRDGGRRPAGDPARRPGGTGRLPDRCAC